MKQATLCLLLKEDSTGKEILLAMKKRGFGVGKWNGVGGKLDPKKGDRSLVDTAVRETAEEIGVKVKEMEKVALLKFRFPYKNEWNQNVHVFMVHRWEGEPIETEEMYPQWFKINDVPFDLMWADDEIWFPQVLQGKKLRGDFRFRPGEVIDDYKIKVTRGFN
ncbi:MAG: 8-oxo-dGTP diphosphatase [bacterium]